MMCGCMYVYMYNIISWSIDIWERMFIRVYIYLNIL
jgi:hypothetical protein